jgi:hypothetical protein
MDSKQVEILRQAALEAQANGLPNLALYLESLIRPPVPRDEHKPLAYGEFKP